MEVISGDHVHMRSRFLFEKADVFHICQWSSTMVELLFLLSTLENLVYFVLGRFHSHDCAPMLLTWLGLLLLLIRVIELDAVLLCCMHQLITIRVKIIESTTGHIEIRFLFGEVWLLLLSNHDLVFILKLIEKVVSLHFLLCFHFCSIFLINLNDSDILNILDF